MLSCVTFTFTPLFKGLDVPTKIGRTFIGTRDQFRLDALPVVINDSNGLSVMWSETVGLTTRPSVLGQDRSQTKKSVLILVLQVWCCVVKHGLVMLVVIMILKEMQTFQVLYIVSLFCAWNTNIVEINSGFTYLEVKSAKCLCLLPLVLVLVLRIRSKHH